MSYASITIWVVLVAFLVFTIWVFTKQTKTGFYAQIGIIEDTWRLANGLVDPKDIEEVIDRVKSGLLEISVAWEYEHGSVLMIFEEVDSDTGVVSTVLTYEQENLKQKPREVHYWTDDGVRHRSTRTPKIRFTPTGTATLVK